MTTPDREQRPTTQPEPPVAPQRERPAVRLLRLFKAPRTRTDSGGGRWPTTWEQFVWDLSPANLAPPNDGLVPPPVPASESWLETVPTDRVEVAYEMARSYRKESDETTRNIELKAARLATALVGMLTGNVALVVFELSHTSSGGSAAEQWFAWLGSSAGSVSVCFLVAALSRAFDADLRMGMTEAAALKDAALDERAALAAEVRGFHVSKWTRKNKATRLIFARAAVSRGMVFLVASGAFGLGVTIANAHASSKPPNPPTFTPAPPTSPSAAHLKPPTCVTGSKCRHP